MTMPEEQTELKKRFTYHPSKDATQARRYEDIRGWGHSMGKKIMELTPQCREQSLALTKLEEVVMWANAAIARRE